MFALTWTIPVNFFMLKHLLYQSCTLWSIIEFNKALANKLCEQAFDERSIEDRFRQVVRSTIESIETGDRKVKYKLLRSIFFEVCSQDGGNKIEFQKFLGRFRIHLTDKSITRVFKIIDANSDGKLLSMSTIFFFLLKS